ncbi:hypothetical protein CNEO3_160070 [Clostridium neonatale]|nr:hypothetical protein CNEO3_160070 [Clostridium neonatale]
MRKTNLSTFPYLIKNIMITYQQAKNFVGKWAAGDKLSPYKILYKWLFILMNTFFRQASKCGLEP